MNTKALIESKTFWVAVAQAVLGVLVIFMNAYPDLQAVGALVVGKSILDMWLRTQVQAPVGGILKR